MKKNKSFKKQEFKDCGQGSRIQTGAPIHINKNTK